MKTKYEPYNEVYPVVYSDGRIYCIAKTEEVAKHFVAMCNSKGLSLHYECWVIYEEDKDA